MIYLDKFKSGNKIKQELYYSFVSNFINNFWKWDNSDINILLESPKLY